MVDARRVKVFRPKPAAWLPLLVVALPISGLGLMVLIQDSAAWMSSIVAIAFGLGILGYNGTVRLVLTGNEVLFKRYGWTVWRTPLSGTELMEGRGGRPPVIPAYLFFREGVQVGYILKSWFDDGAVAELRRVLAS